MNYGGVARFDSQVYCLGGERAVGGRATPGQPAGWPTRPPAGRVGGAGILFEGDPRLAAALRETCDQEHVVRLVTLLRIGYCCGT